MRLEFSSEEKLVLREWARGKGRGNYRRTCPACSSYRLNKTARCLSVKVESDHMVMNCHHCERAGATKLTETITATKFIPPKMERPQGKCVKRLDSGLHKEGIAYLSGRGISLKTAQAFGLVQSKAYFINLRRETEAIAFPYYADGKAYGHKFRSVEEKDHVVDRPLGSLFGIQVVDFSASEDLIICEGEFDPLAFYEAGIPNALSVPNGAGSFSNYNADGTMREQMGFLWDAREEIEKAKRILIAVDNDEPGEKLAEELARRIGRHRCWLLKWPQGCKDANDVLMKVGAPALKECLSAATPWPVEGLYEADRFYAEVDELFENGFGERINTGITPVDEIYSVGPGLLTVVTGIPGMGKSTFVDQIMVNLARTKGYASVICSFENPVPVHIGKLAQMLYQKHFFKTDLPGSYMTKEELDEAKPFIHRHFKFLQQDDGKKAGIESVIERIKTAVFRWGVKIAVIDPWNYVARPKGIESETQFVDDVLSSLRLVAQLYGVHIFLIAHPTKMQSDGEGNYSPPKGYHISGSAAFFSKPDFGLTVHRLPGSGEVKILNWKTRYDWLGKVGEASILYDNTNHVYLSDNWDMNTPWKANDDG